MQRFTASRADLTLLVGYVAQVYGAVVSIAFAPFILRAIGAEAYGLVGVFLVAQAWFQLLDAGLTPAMTRESARFSGGAASAVSLKQTLKGLEAVVMLSALPFLIMAVLAARHVAENWVQRESLSVSDVVIAINLMALILMLRWVSGVRRGLLIGFEQHDTIYGVNMLIATLRFPCIVVFFTLIEPSSTSYFTYQFGISVVEVLVLWFYSQSLVPKGLNRNVLSCICSLRSIAPFALNHGFLALLWILISQSDKLLLSRLLTLSHFGYFTLAIAAAAGVNLITLPIRQMLMPALSRLKAQGDEAGLLASYRRATRVAVVSLSGVTVLFVFFGHAVMLAWTGDARAAAIGGHVLAWYALGNAAMAVATFSYYLQYASGRLSMHTWGTLGFLFVFVPVLYVTTTTYGVQGAAIIWAIAWVVYLFTWVSVTHHVHLPGQVLRWLFNDVLRIFIPVLALGAITRYLTELPDDRVLLALLLTAYGALYSVTGLLVSGLVPVQRFWLNR